MKQKNLNFGLLVLGLIFLGVMSRLTAHAWNFTLIGGLALFTGAFFKRKWISVFILFVSLFISDAVIGFHNQMPAVYLGFGLMVFAGSLMRSTPSRFAVISLSIVGSFVFFLISNFSVWLEGLLYPQTLNGLLECYVMALPFYHNQLIADLVSTFVLFEVARATKAFVVARFDQAEINSI